MYRWLGRCQQLRAEQQLPFARTAPWYTSSSTGLAFRLQSPYEQHARRTATYPQVKRQHVKYFAALDLRSDRLSSRAVEEARGAGVRSLWPAVSAGVVTAAVIPGGSRSCSGCCIAGSSRSSIAAVEAAGSRRHCTAGADAGTSSTVRGRIDTRLLVEGCRCCCIGWPWPCGTIETRDGPEHAPERGTA